MRDVCSPQVRLLVALALALPVLLIGAGLPPPPAWFLPGHPALAATVYVDGVKLMIVAYALALAVFRLPVGLVAPSGFPRWGATTTLAAAAGVGAAILTAWAIPAPHDSMIPVARLGFLPYLIDGVIVAAVCEEIGWRGIADGLLTPRLGLPLASSISAVSFGLAHIGAGARTVVAATLIGLVLSRLRAEFGSVWPCVVAHGLVNFSSIVGAAL